MRAFSSEGIILSRRNFGEADRILSILTKDYGKVVLMAKGIRKPKSRKRGHLEVFGLVKFSAVRGKALPILTEVEVIDSYESLRKSLNRTALAYYLVEVLEKILREDDPHQNVFELARETLTKVAIEQNLKGIRLEFIGYLLELLGFWPRERELKDPDKVLEEVLERGLNSVRVGKKMLT